MSKDLAGYSELAAQTDIFCFLIGVVVVRIDAIVNIFGVLVC